MIERRIFFGNDEEDHEQQRHLSRQWFQIWTHRYKDAHSVKHTQ